MVTKPHIFSCSIFILTLTLTLDSFEKNRDTSYFSDQVSRMVTVGNFTFSSRDFLKKVCVSIFNVSSNSKVG